MVSKSKTKRPDDKVISVRGAREHNLKGVDIDLPRDKLIVITGLSGSGKSSLAFDTIYAEGQRRYVESPVGLCAAVSGDDAEARCRAYRRACRPAISIEQKTTSSNPRSTVGDGDRDLRLYASALGPGGHSLFARRPADRSTARPSARWSTG